MYILLAFISPFIPSFSSIYATLLMGFYVSIEILQMEWTYASKKVTEVKSATFLGLRAEERFSFIVSGK